MRIFYILVSSSDLLQLPDLEILEIRGTGSNRNLIFEINETMPKIKYANFELIDLMADGNLIKKHLRNQHPSEIYDYVPESERYTYNVTLEMEEDVEIVPYDVYVQELDREKRATFIGWTDLEVLRIHNCELDEVYWEMFDGLVKLQHLSLEHNGIKIVPPFAFYGALNIKSLSLAQNEILDLHYRALAGLLELEYLDLSANNLSKLSEITFPPFPSLKSVDLSDNPIEFIFPMTFAIMNGTSDLTLGSASIALDLTNANGGFLNLDNLRSLNLLNIIASGFYQTTFDGLKQLQRLNMKGSLGRIEYDAFTEMPQLKELNVSDCGIFEISMDAFLGVKDLRVIDLSNNKLTALPPGLFDEQKQLQEIYLQNNRLTEVPKKFFSIAPLKLVRLTGNPWICTCEMSDWNQEITNSIRAGVLKSNDDYCIRNPKTGKFDFCNGGEDEYPEYIYGFDNKMSPLCSKSLKKKKKNKQQSVYYALRHTIKCGPSQKDRAQNKLKYTMEKLTRTQDNESADRSRSSDSWKAQQRFSKTQRKVYHDHKMKRTMSKNAKILKEQVHSNNVANYP